MIDTHAHLDDPQFDADRDAVLDRCRVASVEAILCVGTDLVTSRVAVELAQRYPQIYAAVGIHPNSCAAAADGDWAEILALLDRPRVLALGETGLDRYWDDSPLTLQQEYFERHLRAGQDRDLPVIIHCRDAQADMMPMLRRAVDRQPLRAVMHAFSGDVVMAQACQELGLYLSFAGNSTYTNKKFEALREAAKAAADDRILIETDCPYLTPEPFRGKQKRNEPALVAHTAARLATLRSTTIEKFATQTTENARRLFRIE